ncbi:MAG: glycosyltransferase family 4 protein [Gemmatimonadales bacterium]
MRIVYVYDGDWPRGATRVAKETRSLARAGHEVHLVARNSDREAREEAGEWMTIHRLPSVGPEWANRLLNFPYFFNPVWIRTIDRVVRRVGADCLVAGDLPIAPTTYWVARRHGLPVHYDMAEVYPVFLESLWQFEKMGLTDHLVRTPSLAAMLERYVLRRMDTIFVVTEESRDRCLALGVPAEKLVVVGNTPEDVERLQATHELPADLEPWADRLRVLFVGILLGDRGVAEAVEAMRHVVEQVPEAALIVVGDGRDAPRIRETVERLGLEDHVGLLGWHEHSTLAAYYAHCHVGLLPFRDGKHVRITLANKLFDYMAAGLPVVATDLPPMRRVLEETGAGVTFAPGDPQALGQRIVELLKDESARRRFGANGARAVTEKYRWSVDERRFVEALVRRTPLRHGHGDGERTAS